MERIASLTKSWSSAMMILAGEAAAEEEVLLGLCVVVVSLAFLFANACSYKDGF
jgi:hypothetical protein